MAYRVDYGNLGEIKRTPQGGLEILADLTRAGVFSYTQPNGSVIREWRPLSEVSRPETLASLKNAPFTVGHPAPRAVGPSNFGRFAKGHVGSDVRMDGHKTAGTIYVQDEIAIRAIESGRREISCGYDTGRIDDTPGTVPAGEPDAGKPYDRIQRDITYNHAALVPKGRAGSDIRLRLDDAGDSLDHEQKEDSMEKIEVIGGVEYVFGSDAHRDARTRQDAADKASIAEVAKLRNDAQTMKGERDAANAGKVAAETALADATSPVRLDARVAERAQVVAVASRHLGKEFKADGLSDREIRMKVLAKLHPTGEVFETIRTDSAETPVDAGYIRGLWAGLTANAAVRTDERKTALVPASGTHPEQPRAGITRRFREDAENDGEGRHKRPLTISRRKGNAGLQSSMIENQR